MNVLKEKLNLKIIIVDMPKNAMNDAIIKANSSKNLDKLQQWHWQRDIMLFESWACISVAGKASTLNPTVWYFQQMSLFTELRACVHLSGLPRSEYPSYLLSSYGCAWFPFIYCKKKRKGNKNKRCRFIAKIKTDVSQATLISYFQGRAAFSRWSERGRMQREQRTEMERGEEGSDSAITRFGWN